MTKQEQKTEQKKKSKILRILGRVVRWLFIAMFAILLILAIVFQASWKIITLFVILAAGLTLIPKAYRKWFYLSITAVVLAIVIWVFLPDDNQGWRPYTFDKEIEELNAKYYVPDEENAAVIYKKLLNNYELNSLIPQFLDEDLESRVSRYPWKSEDHLKLSKWLDDKNEIMEIIFDATEKKRCMFPVPVTFSIDEQMDRNIAMRRWAILLVISGNNDIGEGHYQRGLEKYFAVLRMSNHASQQIVFVDVLTGFSIEALAIDQLKRFVITGDTATEDLLVIKENLEILEHDFDSDLAGFLEYDKMVMKKIFGIMYEINKKGIVRISRNPTKAIEEVPTLTYLQRRLCKTSGLFGQLFFPRKPAELNTIIDSVYEQRLSELSLNQKQKEDIETFNLLSFKCNFSYLIKTLTKMSIKAYSEIDDIYQRTLAEKKGLLLLISLRKYKDSTGHYPDSLSGIPELIEPETLIDPLNKDTFVYKLTDDGFELYSRGRNNVDEGGEYDSGFDEDKCEFTVLSDDRMIFSHEKYLKQRQGTDANDK